MEIPIKIDKETSYQIWVLKIIAIFTIFFAHMPVSDTTLAISSRYEWMSRLFSFIGMFGVPVFLLLSGYLFKRGNIAKRALNLLIPLIIWGGVTYALHCLKADISSISLKGLTLWILGSNCYLYFVSVLFWIIILYNISQNDYLWISIGIISLLLTQMHIIHYSTTWTPYMNPFNFIIYFTVGHLIRKHDLWHKIKRSWPLLMISVGIILIAYCLKSVYIHVWYFELTSVVINLAFASLLIFLTSSIKKEYESIIRLGKCTFVMYLCHMSFASLLNRILPQYIHGWMELIKVPIAFLFVAMLSYGGYMILNRMRLFSLQRWIGYRN